MTKPKVTRIYKSQALNKRKYGELCEQARLLGKLWKEIWQRFGSINGVGANHRKIRDEWIKTRDFSPLPAKAWKETLRDVLDDISTYEEACKLKVRQDIAKRTNDKKERKRLYTLLKYHDWPSDPYLSRKMRQYKRHGKTSVANHIILEAGVYIVTKTKAGNSCLRIPTFTRGKKLAIPLKGCVNLKGCLRLIIDHGRVSVHATTNQKKFKACGSEIIGVDKGYSEAFADSEGNFYGERLGEVLTTATEKRNARGKARNKLHQIAKKKPHKAKNIYKFNLGRKKLDRFHEKKKILIRDTAFEAVHRIVDHAGEVIAEDLTKPFANKNKWKKYNRLMSAWAKGSLAEALASVTKARGSSLRVVNAAYTSQMDSKTGHLQGRRVGDKFHHVNGDVSQADTNAAVNIKHRAEDTEIGLYTPYKEVKAILLNRLSATGGVSNSLISGSLNGDRPSRTPVTREKSILTESESLQDFWNA